MLKVVLPVVFTCVVATVLRQHLRYLNIRRDIVEDRQPIFYSSDAFHAVTFIKLRRHRRYANSDLASDHEPHNLEDRD